MPSRKKNVFISHHGKDDKSITDLKNLLASKGYELRNSSIDSTKPNNASNEQYIKNEILKPGVDWAGTVIVLIGDKTHTRDYVDWEIKYAQKEGKRVVGIYIRGCTDAELPESFKEYGDALIGWNSDRIIDAIEGKDNSWSNPDSSCYQNPYKPVRGIC